MQPLDYMLSTPTPITLSLEGKAPTSWVFACPLDRPFFDGRQERTISTAQGRKIVENFQAANDYFEQAAPEGATPYRFPVKENHRETGERYGDLLDAKIAGEGDDYGIYIKAGWNADTWEGIQAGQHRHVSIGISPEYTLESGETLGPILTELSLTTVPRLQSIGTIQDTIDIALSQVDLLEGEHQMEELAELLRTVIENQRAILEHFGDDGVEAAEDEEGEEDDEEEEGGEVEASTEAEDSSADDPEPESDDSDTGAPAAIAVDTTELAEEVTERVEASLVEMVDNRIRTMVDNSRGLHLSEVGSEDQPQRGEKDFDTRLNELVSAGKSKREALRIMADEGY